MAKQEVDIGVEGNDGTGDSIRESFRKVNENFNEIYAVFGAGGSIDFTTLGDTPEFLTPYTVPFVNNGATAIDLVEFASDRATGAATDSVLISYDYAGKIVLSTAFRSVVQDSTPKLGGPLDGRTPEGGEIIRTIALSGSAISEAAVTSFNQTYASSENITIDDLVITKGYADNRYIAGALPIRLDDEPADASEYSLNITAYTSGNAVINSHGFDRTINGTPYRFNAEDVKPSVLTNGQTYYLRYFNTNQLSIHATKEAATVQSQNTANSNKIFIVGTVGVDDSHTLTDIGYDETLSGFFLANEAIPRKSIVRRQGDTMTGPLILHDSPGELTGLTTSKEDLQAATKFYVDNTSYAAVDNLYVSTQGDDTMRGVPAGKEGTSLNYAYKSVNAAAARAAEMIQAAESEPGPYFQTITRNDGAEAATIANVEIATLGGQGPVFSQARNLIELNKAFVAREITSYLQFKYPDFTYKTATCERDLNLIMDAIAFDINLSASATLNNSNALTRRAAERYYANASGRIAIRRQGVETVDAIETARDMIAAILLNRTYLQTPINAVTNAAIPTVTTTLNHNLVDGNIVVFKSVNGMIELNDNYYYIKVTGPTTFELFSDATLNTAINTTAFTAYASGGTIGIVYQTDNKQTFDIGNDAAALARAGVNEKFNLVVEIITNGINEGAVENNGRTYLIKIDPGEGNESVDQAIANNRDIIPGKVVVGKISKAQGRVVNYFSRVSPNNPDLSGLYDVAEVHLLKPIDFIPNEDLEYGNFVKQKQITIFVESGFYEEDYPIKVAANVSIKGDEFRRVIIRPKRRISQSRWADTYLYRDRDFDGITVSTAGTRFYNQTNEWQGHFGYHYLANPEKPQNTGTPAENAGGYDAASAILRENKEFIQQEVLGYINSNVNDLLYDKSTFATDLEEILSGLTYDFSLATTYNQVRLGLKFQRTKSIYLDQRLKDIWVVALTHAKSLVAALPGVGSRCNVGFDTIINIITNGNVNTDDGATLPITYTAFAGTTANGANARNQLQANKEFIAQEALAYLKSLAPKKYIDEQVRLTDFRNFVDAITYDMFYGGNVGSVEFARDLFDRNGAQLKFEINTRQETLTTLDYIKTVIEDVLLETTVTPTTGNSEVQDTTNTPATSTEVGIVNSYINIIYTQINNNNLINIPTSVPPSLADISDSGIIAAKSSVDGNIATVTSSVLSYLDSDPVTSFTYNTDKCARDVGLIVDALVDDLIAGGDEFSTEVQGEYFESYILKYNSGGFGGQENVTKRAIEYVKTIAARTFTGTYDEGDLWQNPLDNDYIEFDGKYGIAEAGTDTVVNGLVTRMVFAFDRDYNPPRRNDEMDVFMMNDATIIRNVTVQGHGGFLLVLDPEGQVLTKSPYVQTGSSFSKSLGNQKIFGGGMFVDAYTGNLPMYIPTTIDPVGEGNPGDIESGKTNAFELWVRSEEGTGLFIRQPELPAPFYIEGRRYQVNAISRYSKSNGWCKLHLDPNSNNSDGFDESQFEENVGQISRTVYIQTAGNRSMLGNDFTQINDLGYGLVTNNGAFSEMVSMFTYYCQAAYYAKNGSEIRSLNGSNGYGYFGLVAEGADPNEIPDQVTYATDMVQPAKSITYLDGTDNTNIQGSLSVFITDLKYPPAPNSTIQIDHGAVIGVLRYRVGSVAKITTLPGGVSQPTDGIYTNDIYRLSLTGKVGGENGDFFNNLQADVVDGTLIEFRTGTTHIFDKVKSKGEIVERPSTAINFDESDLITYRSTSFSGSDNFGNELSATQVQTTFNLEYDHIEVPVDFANASGGNGTTISDTNIAIATNTQGLQLDASKITRLTRDIYGNQPVASSNPNAYNLIANNLRYVQEEVIQWINTTYPALDYDVNKCYRDVGLIVRGIGMDLKYGGNATTVQNANKYYVGTVSYLPESQKAATIAAQDKAKEIVTQYILTKAAWVTANTNGYTQSTAGSNAEAGTATTASTLMDIVTDAIELGAATIPSGIAITGYAGGMNFVYAGRTHQIVGFTDNGGGTATIAIDSMPVTDLTSGGVGIAQAFTANRILYAGIQIDTTAEITVSISLCRATGHDFTQIGLGSFNTANYPSVILGKSGNSLAPFYVDSESAESGQVWERRKGRVFWMSTDQYGFFRVGQFFSVDQAQGSIAFSGELEITNANGFGFKKGVVVDEFSIDDTMVDESDTAVPVEKAIVSYVNKRLGRDKNNNTISGLGSVTGYLPLNGTPSMLGDLKMGGNKIQNLDNPDNGDDATNKAYVDDKILNSDNFDVLRETTKNDVTSGDFVTYTGYRKILIEVPQDGSGSDTYEVGDIIKNNAGNVTAVVKDIVQTTDDIVGENQIGNEIWVVTYELSSIPDFTEEAIKGDGSKADITSFVLRGPFDEIGNANNSVTSDVNITLTRNDGVLDSSGVGAIAELEIQLRNGVVGDTEVAADAAIAQSKLLMNRATTKDTSSGLYGSGDAVGQTFRGLGVFDADNFTEEVRLTLSGTITAAVGDVLYQGSNRGVVSEQITDNTLVVIKTTNMWVPSATVITKASFLDGIERAAQSTSRVVTAVNNSGFIGLKERSIGFDKLTSIATDTVIGRSLDSTGDASAIPFNTVVKEGLGVEDKDFFGGASKTENDIVLLSGNKLNFATLVSVQNGEAITQGNIRGYVQGTVYNANSIYVVNVINTNTLAGANFGIGAVNANISGAIGSVTSVNTGENLIGRVLVKLDEGIYGTTPISIGSANDSIVRRTSSGAVQADTYILGGSSTNTVLSESGNTLKFTTPNGGTILTSVGNNRPVTQIGGNIVIGDIANNSANEGTFQDASRFGEANTVAAGLFIIGQQYKIATLGSTNFTLIGASANTLGVIFTATGVGAGTGTATVQGYSNLAARWVYTNFIEALTEKTSTSTGISIGKGTGFTNAADQTIILVTNGAERLVVTNTTITANADIAADAGQFTGNLTVLGANEFAVTNASAATRFLVSGATGNTTIGTGTTGTLSVGGEISTSSSLVVATSATFGGGYGATGTTISTAGNISTNGTLTVDSTTTLNGNTDIGNATTDTLTITASVDSNIIPTGTRNLGSSTSAWSTVYGGTFSGTATTAKYADLAENYLADAEYAPGTVLVLGGTAEVTTTNTKGDHRVAGVVTTNPAHLMNSALEGEYVVGVALSGRVPVNVVGAVRKGDIIVTSAMPGFACVDNNPKYGTIIGKAITEKTDSERGVVEVLVG
jgi:hypothetical protein